MLGFSQLGFLALGEMPPSAVADTYRVECNGAAVVGFVGSSRSAGDLTVLAQATRSLVGSARALAEITIAGQTTPSFVGTARGLGVLTAPGVATVDLIGASVGPSNFISTDSAIVLWRHIPIRFNADAAASAAFASSTRTEIIIHTQGVLTAASEIIN